MANPAPLTLPVGATENSIRVHPVVLFTICDAFIRRNEGQDRVIGTLLGTVGDGAVDIKNCYAVPHSESNDAEIQVHSPAVYHPFTCLTRLSKPVSSISLYSMRLIFSACLSFVPTLAQVSVDLHHHQTMASLQRKVNSRERIVGWFSTGTSVSGSDALIHSFYAGECPNPVHLILDTTLQNNRMAVKAYVSRPLTVQGRELAREFQEVACEVRTVEAERSAGDLLGEELTEKLPSDLEGLGTSLEKLRLALEAAERYVNDVVEGRCDANVSVGRQLAETVATVPHFSPSDLSKLVQDSQNDVLLTSYLASLIRAHIALADKLGTMQLPLL